MVPPGVAAAVACALGEALAAAGDHEAADSLLREALEVRASPRAALSHAAGRLLIAPQPLVRHPGALEVESRELPQRSIVINSRLFEVERIQPSEGRRLLFVFTHAHRPTWNRVRCGCRFHPRWSAFVG